VKIGGPERGRFAESGVMSAFVALVATSLLVVAGFTTDVGRAIAEQRLAADEAEQAARAAAGQVSAQGLRNGQIVLNDESAMRVAQSFMSLSGHPGSTSIQGGVVTTRVTIAMPTSVLGIVGIRAITVSATARASDVTGVTQSR
jgi:Flp pilus assembly protein TadG